MSAFAALKPMPTERASLLTAVALGAYVQLADGQPVGRNVEVAGTDAYFKTEVNADNTNCIRVARSQGSFILNSGFMSNKIVYWVDGSSVTSNSATSNDPTMMGSNVTISNSDKPLAAFTESGTTTYFADKVEGGGFVYMSPLTANSSATVIARKQPGITSIAGDASGVYWAGTVCSIMSLGNGVGTL
jgi:hypothetical protein